MNLQTRVLAGYGVGLTLLIGVLIWAVANLVSVGKAGEAILRENYKSILAAENMIEAIERQDSAILLLMLNYEDEALSQFHENENGFLQWLGRAKDNITIEGEGEIIQTIDAGYSAYLRNFTELCRIRDTDENSAGGFYHETTLPSFKSVRDACIRLREANQNAMFTSSRRAGDISRRAIWSTVAVAFAALGAGLVFSLLMSRRLVRPITALTDATEALALGIYNTQVPTDGSDELGQLGYAFNMMARKLGEYNRLNVEKVIAEKRRGDAVLRSIDDGVVLVDDKFRVLTMNPPAARILNAASQTVEGRHFLEVVGNNALFELIRQAVESGRTPTVSDGKEILSFGEGESVRHYTFAVTPVLSDSGGIFGVVLLLRDVTRLKELDRMKSEFVMAASHELKTPLQSLGMSVELLLEDAPKRLTETERELLTAANEELQRLKSLVNDLLSLSRIESGKAQMAFDSVPVAALIDKAIGAFKVQADRQEVELARISGDDTIRARADAGRITWVLTNLISNALRHVERGGQVRISVERTGQWIQVCVADNGEGIPLEYQSRIFEKFVQIPGQKNLGGSGLGLAICRQIIRAHMGTIWVESKPGEGSAFTFTLPVAA
ncbi:MAG TPA: ATP-binding protein [Candidatus Brocadiia bacterium]|nr:ATP-binding protein [Candidatus Brocadiia bacterium]